MLKNYKKEENIAGMVEEIDSLMEHIWRKVVKKEYDSGRILEESNLHLRVSIHSIEKPRSN